MDDFIQSVNQKMYERQRFTISECSREFSQDYPVTLGYQQVMCKMGSKNAHGHAQNAEHDCSFNFLRVITRDGNEFLNHII
jgi:hypothetical protein